jgi:hypothetical protein
MKLRRSLSLWLTGALALGPIHAQPAERWMLMSRHDGCAPVTTLKRKVAGLNDNASPEAVAVLLRQQGKDVSLRPMEVPKGRAVQLASAQAGLDLVFVTADLCPR